MLLDRVVNSASDLGGAGGLDEAIDGSNSTIEGKLNRIVGLLSAKVGACYGQKSAAIDRACLWSDLRDLRLDKQLDGGGVEETELLVYDPEFVSECFCK